MCKDSFSVTLYQQAVISVMLPLTLFFIIIFSSPSQYNGVKDGGEIFENILLIPGKVDLKQVCSSNIHFLLVCIRVLIFLQNIAIFKHSFTKWKGCINCNLAHLFLPVLNYSASIPNILFFCQIVLRLYSAFQFFAFLTLKTDTKGSETHTELKC